MSEPVLWDLPKGWCWSTFSTVATIAANLVPPQSWGELPHIAPDNIARDTGRLLAYRTVAEDAVISAKHLFRPGQLLYSKIRPYLNKCVRVDFEGLCSADMYPLDARIVTSYLHHYILSSQFVSAVSDAAGSRTVLPKTNQKQLSQVPVPVAPENEQLRISAAVESYHSRLDDAVSTLERVERNLKRYRASVLKAAVEGRLVTTEAVLAKQEGRNYETASVLLDRQSERNLSEKKRAGRLWGAGVVPELSDQERQTLPEGWCWAKVQDLGSTPEDVVQVGPMSMRSEDFSESGVPVLNVGCVQWGYVDESKIHHLPEDQARSFGRYRVVPGDVLFTRSGTVGRTALAMERHDGWLITFHLLRARTLESRCLPQFLRIVLEGAPHVRRQTREASIGTTRAGFNTMLLAMLDVPVPPLKEQHRIVAEVERILVQVQHALVNVELNRRRCRRLRQSVVRWAFEGKLVDQDPSDEPASVLLDRIKAESSTVKPATAAAPQSKAAKKKAKA